MTQPNVYKPCGYKYLCQKLREGKCSLHTEQHKLYVNTQKFLREIFTGRPEKLMLGKVNKLEGCEKFKFTPCKKEIIQQHPELSFTILEDSEAEILSEEFYYEVEYEENDDKNGEFYVKIMSKFGKIGEAKDDVEAMFYGQVPIYEDRKKETGNFRQGTFKEKRNGDKVVHSGEKEYPVLNEQDQNRALSGSTVNFREVKKCAQIVSIVKNPFEDKDIYGMLEATSEANKQINMEHLYCPIPEDVNWDLLEEVFRKTGERFATSFKSSTLTKKEFKDKYAVILQIEQKDPRLEYLTGLIFMNASLSLEIGQMKKRWDSLYNLVNHRKQMKEAQGNYYFKPWNKDLPIFQCMPLKEDLLNKNGEIWRSYVKVKYIGWPAASKHPWVKIESVAGLIGNYEDDTRVILEKNHVTTDWFSKEIRENEKELLKAWDEKIEEGLESCEKVEEKVFTIDGETTRYRDDGFSVRRLADGKSCEIGIHIADVTRTVKEETEIYKEAESRFHSCYVGDFFRPMLPKKLGEHLSLKQDQWRYAFSLFILMNKEGVIDLEKTRLKHVMIKPVKNYSYREVDQIIISQAADDEVKEAVLLMNELGMKLSERRKRLGCKLEINEENPEKNSQAHMMVEEFMVLANEIATDYVKHQEEALRNKLLKIRNEEKKIVREENEKKEEEKRGVKEEEKEEETDEKDAETMEKNVQAKTEEKEEDKQIEEEIEEKEEKISEKEEVSEDEEEVEVKRKDSESDSEEKSQTDSDFSSSNERKRKEKDAMEACNFLIRTWREAIDDELDLTDKLVFLESRRRMKESRNLRSSLKQYLEYLLRVKNQMIELVLRKKLPVKNSQEQINDCPGSFEAQERQIKASGTLNISKQKLFEEEKFSILGEESPPSSAGKSVKSPLEEISMRFSTKLSKPKQKKKTKQQQKVDSPDEICEKNREPELSSPEVFEKIGEDSEETAEIESKKESENVVKDEEIIVIEDLKEEPQKIKGENEIIDQQVIQEKQEEGNIEEVVIESEKEEEGFSVKQSENIMKRYDKLENSQKMKFTSPIRRFSDILVHELMNEILEIEEKITKINETIQEKLAEQKQEKEGDEQKNQKRIKTRYQIFQDLDSQLKSRISQLEKLQREIRAYYEKNSSNKKGGMDRAEREKNLMEVCKSVITGQESILADAIFIGVSKDKKVEVFLLKYSVECTLSCVKVEKFGRGKAKIYFADKSTVELNIYEDIKVKIHVKKTFPLDFDVSYHRKN